MKSGKWTLHILWRNKVRYNFRTFFEEAFNEIGLVAA